MFGIRNLVCFMLIIIKSSSAQIDESTTTINTVAQVEEFTTVINSSADVEESTANINITADDEESTTVISPAADVDKGWYTVVGPKNIKANLEYECVVSTRPVAPSEPTLVTVKIVGPLNSTTTVNTTQSVIVPAFTTKFIKLQIGNATKGVYNLTVRGEGGINFSNSTELGFIYDRALVLVQTDRAIYNPGAKVHFRVLVLDKLTKPHKNNSLHVYIKDGDGNRVKEWRHVKTKEGLWSGELQLSDRPVLGYWSINALAQNKEYRKSFQIAEYILPKFEVSINAPKSVFYKDGKIVVRISARYTFGGPVKGDATVSGGFEDERRLLTRKYEAIDGDATFEFDINEDLRQANAKEGQLSRVIAFVVEVEEALTGKKHGAFDKVMLYFNEITFQLIKKPSYLKPGLKMEAYLSIQLYDGTPAIDRSFNFKVFLKYSFGFVNAPDEEISYEALSNGLFKFSFLPPRNATFLVIKAIYNNQTYNLAYLRINLVSLSNNYIQAVINTENLKANSEVEVVLSMTEHTPTVYYMVKGLDEILLANSVSVNQGETTASFKFLATPAMTTSSKLLVYYLREDNELIADFMDLTIEFALPNFVKVISNVSESEPGLGIQLSVESKPNSLVSLLGIDLSSILLKKGNDITKGDVEKEIKSYEYEYNPSALSEHSTLKVFQDTHIFILTNGLTGLELESYGAAYGAGGASSPRLRSKFPETWIWQDINTNKEGKAFINETLPDTITSWIITAFALHPMHGLGVIEQPTKVRVFRPFFISLDLPYSIIRGETVTIPVLVFNYMERLVTAEVMLLNTAGQFYFGDSTNSTSDNPGKVLFKKTTVTVKPNSGERTSFIITATELGYIRLRVSAISDLAGDLVERQLLVKAEGETQYKNQAVFVYLDSASSLEETVSIKLPDNFVEGSARVEVSAVGDILGTSLQNLERLIRIPFGCGEQNMLTFVPNIAILDYLKNSKQLTPLIEKKCLQYMETGYQRELTYRHWDGSFSAFGNFDKSGSTWLTAFVLKSFASAQPYMDIDRRIVDEGLSWLASKQAPNGSFPEVGSVVHKDMQGGSGQGLALTSFTLLPFLAFNKPKYKYIIEISLNYIESQLDAIRNDSYSLALSTYVLHLAKHPAKDTAFEMLQSNAQTDDSKRWWKSPTKKVELRTALPNLKDLDLTASAVASNLQRALAEDSSPTMSWSLPQMYSNNKRGTMSYKDTDGMDDPKLEPTSYSQLSFIADDKPKNKSYTDDFLDNLEKQLDGIENDIFSLALSSVRQHSSQPFNQYSAPQTYESNTRANSSLTWWRRAAKKTDSKNPHSKNPNSVNIEMTSYALLTYLERDLIKDSIPIISWLMSQQNFDGGFASTQDTVVALTALSKLALKVDDKKPDLTVNFSTEGGFSKDIAINSSNSIILQKLLIPGNATGHAPEKVKVFAKGSGLAVIQVAYSYNENVKGAWPMFNIRPKVNSSVNQLLLDVCSSFMSGPEGDGDESSNMVVMEISLPSGFAVEQYSVSHLMKSKGVKRVELNDANTHVALYFNKMTREELCPQIYAQRTHKVKKSKPVPITVYDYYDQSRRARVFYSLPEDTCKKDAC